MGTDPAWALEDGLSRSLAWHWRGWWRGLTPEAAPHVVWCLLGPSQPCAEVACPLASVASPSPHTGHLLAGLYLNVCGCVLLTALAARWCPAHV